MALKIAVSVLFSSTAWLLGGVSMKVAEAVTGMAQPRQLGFQPAATETMEKIASFHDFLMIIMTFIVLLVIALLLVIMIRFNRKANPVPSKTSHNTLLEIAWTIFPVLILMAIAVPSFKLLYFQDVAPEADMVIKATGHQWYWSYEYPDHDDLTFDSIMLPDSYYAAEMSQDVRDERDAALADIQHLLGRGEAPEIHRLLDTDTRIVVPVGKVVKVLVMADDVIHAWAIPAFGIKMDAVPGRTNETWFRANQIGTFYGQCSELCGIRHSFMPIVVEVVSEEDFKAWLGRAGAMYNTANVDAPVRLAENAAAQ